MLLKVQSCGPEKNKGEGEEFRGLPEKNTEKRSYIVVLVKKIPPILTKGFLETLHSHVYVSLLFYYTLK